MIHTQDNHTTSKLTAAQRGALTTLVTTLINQKEARVLIPPNAAESGFWFGGGNLTQDDAGTLWLVGRYRNYGDSRTGLAAGTRGLECVLFRSDDQGQTFHKVQSWSKADLSHSDGKVLSIEGTSLHQRTDGTWALYISVEKALSYPAHLSGYQKPGTGVWVIDCMTGPAPDQLDISTLSTVLVNHTHPEYLHVKDPVVYDQQDGTTAMIFCTHPFSWTSSNSGLAVCPLGSTQFHVKSWEVVSRGAGWDVAATRITARFPVPQVGLFADQPPTHIYFYDGAECLRSLEENSRAHSRPRGYSCEEIGGAIIGWDDGLAQYERLSPLEPLFMSPWGTGCSRYVETLTTADGIFAIWQQAQADGSQPLVSHFVPMDVVEGILVG